MRPILYNANETAFETYGLGEIDATKAQVTRERNGNYTLYIEYPASGPLAGTFKNDMRIKSDAGLRTKNQTFFISRILKDSTGILKVYAKHISHLTEKMAIRNNTNVSGTAQAALAIWALNALGGIRFDTWSDIDLSSKTSWNIADFKTARDALGGVKGSILDVWGGEYEFDNTVIRLHKQLGRKSPTVLEYGRNILRAEDDQDIEGAYTSVYPYATYTPENQGTGEGGATSQQITVELPEKYVDGPYIGLYNERRVLIVDFSSNFKDKEVPTIDKLRRLAKEYAINNRLGLPKINTKIEYVDLSKTLDYKLTQILEEAELCDIVPVYYPQIGLTSEDAKLTTIVYDVLLEQNDSVEVGAIGDGFKSSMTSNLSGKIDDLANNQQRLVNTLPDYLLNAQGNKVWYNRPDTSEHKVGDIWFEKNGLYDRMYVWNGSMWEKRIDTEDVDKIKKEVDKQLEQAKQSTAIEIEKANAKAQEALVKAGTIPDANKLSDQIKTLILNSPDLSRKVTETFNNADNGDTIYSKVYSKVAKNFATKGEFENIDRVQNSMGQDLIGLSKKIETQTVEFNKLTESNKLYERILGTSETGAPDKLSRLVMSSEIFKTEVGKYVTDDNNLIVNSMSMATNTLVNANRNGVEVTLNDGVFSIKAQGLTGFNFTGFSLPIYVKKIYRGETYTLGFKYRFKTYPDHNFAFNVKNHKLNKILLNADIGNDRPPLNEWREFQQTFTVREDFLFGEDRNFPFYIYLVKNGWVEFKEPILVRGSRTGPYKPSQFDDAYKSSDEAKELASNAQAKAIQVAEQARQAKETAEATRTQVTQLAGSWAVKNLNSNGDVLNSINVLADGTNRIDGRLTHITGQTVIDEAVIDGASIKSLSASKLSGGEADFAKMNVVNFDAKNVTSGTFKGLTFEGGRIKSLDGSLSMDLNNKKIRLNGDNVGIVREFKDYPTQFIRYEAQRENNQNHARTIIGSNRNGSEEWNSASFSGIVIDNNSNNEVDKLFQYSDYNYMRHASGDDGWNFSVVTQTLVPGTWNKNSEIWCRHFVIPKKTKSDTETPTEFIRLDDSVAALWKLWAHALGQIGMTEAMKTVIQGFLNNFGYSRPHI